MALFSRLGALMFSWVDRVRWALFVGGTVLVLGMFVQAARADDIWSHFGSGANRETYIIRVDDSGNVWTEASGTVGTAANPYPSGYFDALGNLEDLQFERPAATALSSTDQITPSSYLLLTSTGGALTMATTPYFTTDGVSAGQFMLIESATTSLSFRDDGTLSDSGVSLSTPTLSLSVGDVLGLVFNGTNWLQLFWSNNL